MFNIKKEILYEIKSRGYIQYTDPVDFLKTMLQTRLALTFDKSRLLDVFNALLKDGLIIKEWDTSRKTFYDSTYFCYRVSAKGIAYLEK
jgi:hypothetical protein